MKLTDQERRRFSAYCKYMADMEQQSLKAKQKLLEGQSLPKPLVDEMTKNDKLTIAGYMIVSQELDRWDNAETISARDVGEMPSD